MCQNLREITGRPLITAENLIEATQDPGAFVQVSSVLKRISVKLSKICNDLRLLSSGPRAGLNEINPCGAGGFEHHAGKGQPGDTRGRHAGVLFRDRQRRDDHHGGRGGQLQLNAFEPIIAYSLFDSVAS